MMKQNNIQYEKYKYEMGPDKFRIFVALLLIFSYMYILTYPVDHHNEQYIIEVKEPSMISEVPYSLFDDPDIIMSIGD